MRVRILTPCYNAASHVQGCLESVRTQTSPLPENEMEIHHHVQDGGSTMETLDLLRSFANRNPNGSQPGYQFTYDTEPDRGMYDALNKAYARTDGELIGHLNTDEQYLPGTLPFVTRFFADHPGCEILCGGVVVITASGEYVCSRLPTPLSLWHTAACHLSVFTAATFYRRRIVDRLGMYMDASYKTAGDADFFIRVLRSGVPIQYTRRYLALFMDSGNNLALSPLAKQDEKRLQGNAPPLACRLKPALELRHRFLKLIHGAYHPRPFTYTFVDRDLQQRQIHVAHPRGVWRHRL